MDFFNDTQTDQQGLFDSGLQSRMWSSSKFVHVLKLQDSILKPVFNFVELQKSNFFTSNFNMRLDLNNILVISVSLKIKYMFNKDPGIIIMTNNLIWKILKICFLP